MTLYGAWSADTNTVRATGGGIGTTGDGIAADADNVGGTIVAGALGSLPGSYHYHVDASVTGNNALWQLALNARTLGGGASATQRHYGGAFVLNVNVGGTTPNRTPLFWGSSASVPFNIADNFGVYYNAPASGDGLIHFFINGTEIDSAHAFSPATGTQIGFIVEIGLTSPFTCTLYYDNGNGVFVAQQSGNAASAPARTNPRVGLNQKGANYHYTLDANHLWCQEDGGGANTLLQHTYVYTVMGGVPNSDGGNYQGFSPDSGGTKYTRVSTIPESDASYVHVQQTQGASVARQSFPTDARGPTGHDSIMFVAVAAMLSIVKVVGGTIAAATFFSSWRSGGSDYDNSAGPSFATNFSFSWEAQFTGGTPTDLWGYEYDPAASAPWTYGPMNAGEIGVAAQFISGTATLDFEVAELYKIVSYRPGLAPRPFVIRSRQLAKRHGRVFMSLAPPAAAGPPVTPNRRRWVWVS